MGAVWMRFRIELRSQWRAWMALAVLAGVGGGFVVAAVAGARRTDSALARHLVAFRFPDVTVHGDTDSQRIFGWIRTLPQVRASAVSAELGYCARGAGNRNLFDVGPRAVVFTVSIDGRDGVAVRRPKLLQGRLPDPRRPHEVLVDSRAAARFGVRAGGAIPIRVLRGVTDAGAFRCDPRRDDLSVGRRIDLRVVGVRAMTTPFPRGTVLLTPAFDRAYGEDGFYFGYWMSVRLERGAVDIPGFEKKVVPVVGRREVALERDDAAKVQRSISHQAQAVRLAAGAGALLALVLLGQALVRTAVFAAVADPSLRALGMTRHQLLAVGVARAGTMAAAAAALTAGLAIVLSPLTPIGLARELEPDPGLAVDRLAVGLGSAAVFLAVVLTGAFASARATRSPVAGARLPSGPTGRSAPADVLARWGLPVSVVSGARLALTRGSGATAVPVGGTLLGAVVAAAVVATALTFSASLSHLFSTPRLYGQNWDYRTEYPFLREPAAFAALRADPAISDVARGEDRATIVLNGRQVGAVAMEDRKGRIRPVTIDGVPPERSDEILLAPKTLDALALDVGDTVEARVAFRARMRIVGRGVVPESNSVELGEGAWLTLEAYKRLDPDADPWVLHARIAPGADRDATLARLEEQSVTPAPGPPRTVADFGGVDDLPLVVSALLAAIASGTLAHTLATAIRRRRRHLAILKTLGFDRRQLLATVAWQATTFAVIGLVVGLPLGVATGRWTWNLFAEEIGVIPEPVTPLGLILLVVPAGILLANLVAVLPARSAARTRAALVLRAE